MGSKLGVLKIAAKKVGLSLEQYQDRIRSGQKRCTFCEEWKDKQFFDKDTSRWDVLTAGCRECRNERAKAVYSPIDVLFRLPAGPQRIPRRRGDKAQAKARINHDVEHKLRPNPNDLFCAKCGHKGNDRRHEYHHIMGYDELHHYDVIPLCSRCHHEEHPRHGNQNEDRVDA